MKGLYIQYLAKIPHYPVPRVLESLQHPINKLKFPHPSRITQRHDYFSENAIVAYSAKPALTTKLGYKPNKTPKNSTQLLCNVIPKHMHQTREMNY